MNPLVVLSALFAAAYAAPSNYYGAPLALAHAPVAVAAPALLPVEPAVISLPAPYTTQQQALAVTSIHKPAPIVTKQVHYGDTSYISGYTTQILKPAIPDLRIAVPTALKGTQSYNAPIVKVQTEVHTVNEPYEVPKPYDVPYDVIKHVERIVEVPTPVHVAKPFPVLTPVAVRGEPIIRKTVGPAIVRDHHNHVLAQPALFHGAYHHQPALAYGAHHYAAPAAAVVAQQY